MPTNVRGESRSTRRRLLSVVGTASLLGIFPAAWYDSSATVIGGLVAGGVGAHVVAARTDKRAREDRQQLFEQWARSRGLEWDPEPIPGLDRWMDPDRPILLQEQSLNVTRAASTTTAGGRITVLEWKCSTGSKSGKSLRMSGLVVRTAPTGSHLMMRPSGRFRLPQLPGTPPVLRTGHDALDAQFVITLEGGREPAWIDASVAAELVAAGRDKASIEVQDDHLLLARLQTDPDTWDALLADGRRLAAAFARVLGS